MTNMTSIFKSWPINIGPIKRVNPAKILYPGISGLFFNSSRTFDISCLISLELLDASTDNFSKQDCRIEFVVICVTLILTVGDG